MTEIFWSFQRLSHPSNDFGPLLKSTSGSNYFRFYLIHKGPPELGRREEKDDGEMKGRSCGESTTGTS